MLCSARIRAIRRRLAGVVVVVGVVVTIAVVPDVGVAGVRFGRREPAGLDLRWRAATPGVPATVLADDSGAVAFAEDGRVTALADDGAEVWRTDTGDGKVVLFQVRPSIGAGLVVAPADRREVIALERATGALRWRYPFAGVVSTGVGTAPDGVPLVAAVNRAGELAVLDGTTGTPRWTSRLAEYDESSRAGFWFGGDRLLVQWTPTTNGSRFAVFDVASGAAVWSREMLAASSPSLSGGAVLFAEMTGSAGTRERVAVQSVDLASGEPRWVTEFVTRSLYFTSAASVASEDDFAIVDLDGEIRVFDVSTGELRWKRATSKRQYAAALRISAGVLSMSTYGSGLVALTLAHGRPVDTEPVGGVQLGLTIEATAAAGSRLYLLVSENGPARDAGEVWAFEADR